MESVSSDLSRLIASDFHAPQSFFIGLKKQFSFSKKEVKFI